MKIAVSAANGQLGKAIVQELIKTIGADNVVGIARTPEKAKNLNIEIRKGDYNSYEQFANALKGIDKVLIVSGMDHPDKRIDQHRNIIRAAEDNGLKKIVYTSILGKSTESAFGPVIKSNRQTEKDIAACKIDWAIGRNGLYIEPDLEYLEQYKAAGCIWNNAAEGKCAYTSRQELAIAYTELLLNDNLKGEIYGLSSTPITQQQLADYINAAYGTKLIYKYMPTQDYLKERTEQLGDFIGTVVAGIYEGISKGSFDVDSDFEKILGRPHKSVPTIIQEYKSTH